MNEKERISFDESTVDELAPYVKSLLTAIALGDEFSANGLTQDITRIVGSWADTHAGDAGDASDTLASEDDDVGKTWATELQDELKVIDSALGKLYMIASAFAATGNEYVAHKIRRCANDIVDASDNVTEIVVKHVNDDIANTIEISRSILGAALAGVKVSMRSTEEDDD